MKPAWRMEFTSLLRRSRPIVPERLPFLYRAFLQHCLKERVPCLAAGNNPPKGRLVNQDNRRWGRHIAPILRPALWVPSFTPATECGLFARGTRHSSGGVRCLGVEPLSGPLSLLQLRVARCRPRRASRRVSRSWHLASRRALCAEMPNPARVFFTRVTEAQANQRNASSHVRNHPRSQPSPFREASDHRRNGAIIRNIVHL
jgi:hypothetical protein